MKKRGLIIILGISLVMATGCKGRDNTQNGEVELETVKSLESEIATDSNASHNPETGLLEENKETEVVPKGIVDNDVLMESVNEEFKALDVELEKRNKEIYHPTEAPTEEVKPEQWIAPDNSENVSKSLNGEGDMTIKSTEVYPYYDYNGLSSGNLVQAGDLWIDVHASLVEKGYTTTLEGKTLRISINNVNDYLEVTQIHSGELDLSKLSQKQVDTKTKEITGLTDGKIDDDKMGFSASYAYPVKYYGVGNDATTVYWCQKGVYVLHWHSDKNMGYKDIMNNILPSSAMN